ncbi:MAG: hypothetical protein KGL13_10140, partial [Gammaproteobacteria bacterium]|nr:hypothetical protein [Gammaproteobacteria bacterium]
MASVAGAGLAGILQYGIRGKVICYGSTHGRMTMIKFIRSGILMTAALLFTLALAGRYTQHIVTTL